MNKHYSYPELARIVVDLSSAILHLNKLGF